MIKTSIINLVLRGLALGSKFLLLLFIARYLTPEELGIWGLVNATIAVSLYFLGLDFYIFNTREILTLNEAERAPLIRDQMVFHGLVYLIALPLTLIVFFMDIISWEYIGWFYGLLVLEHISQESVRLLTTLSRPIMATTVLFLRSGAWVYVLASIAYYNDNIRELTYIWFGWMIGVAASIGLTVYAFRNVHWKETSRVPIDWKWMIRGLKVSLPLFCATMSFVGIQFADRYFLQHYWGEASVGIYTFYAGVANVVHIVVFTGIVMILYPRLISSYKSGEFDQYRTLMRKMGLGIIGSAVALIIIAALLIEPVLRIIDKQIYIDHLEIFWIMLATMLLLCVSYVPHYTLFVRNFDKGIILSSVIALGVGIIANSVLVPEYSLKGAAFATLISMATMVLIKSFLALRWRSK